MLLRGETPITPEMGHNLAVEIGAYTYLECSALEFDGIDRVFNEAIRCAIISKNDVCVNKKKSRMYYTSWCIECLITVQFAV